MQTALTIKEIDLFIQEFTKFIYILIYFSKMIKNFNDIAAFTFVIRETYLINNLKVKMLIKTDFLNLEDFIIDIKNKTIMIESCKVEISLKYQLKDFYLRTIHV